MFLEFGMFLNMSTNVTTKKNAVQAWMQTRSNIVAHMTKTCKSLQQIFKNIIINNDTYEYVNGIQADEDIHILVANFTRVFMVNSALWLRSSHTVNSKWWIRQGCGRWWSWSSLGYYSGTWLQGVRKTKEKLIHKNWSQSRDLKPSPPTYEARAQLTRPRRSTHFCNVIINLDIVIYSILSAYLHEQKKSNLITVSLSFTNRLSMMNM